MRYLIAMRAASMRGVEALARRAGGDDRDRRLTVAAVHRLQQVALLGLGRQPGRRAAALDVHDEQRQLDADGQADRLALERDARTGRGRDGEVAGEGGAERRADGADLVLGLEGAHAEVLVLGQLVEDVRGRRDRVAAEEQRQPAALGGGDQAEGQRLVAGDLAVAARRAATPARPRRRGRTSRSSRRTPSRPAAR